MLDYYVGNDEPEIICICPPAPELLKKIQNTKEKLAKGEELPSSSDHNALDFASLAPIIGRPRKTRAHTFERLPSQVSSAGTLKVLVILVDFPDMQGSESKEHYEDLLFSSNTFSTKSMREYFEEVSSGKLLITGDVFGWYRMPQNLTYYANNNNGTGDTYPRNTRKLIEDAIIAANTDVNYSDYDNDGDGMVDAIFVVHAGQGAEVTGNKNHIWSHRWSISPMVLDGVQIKDYTIEPEDGRIGVFSHELTHVFGIPDLYDTDKSSMGIGDWCLMAGGSWNNNGRTPAHPSAWVKKKLGWINPVNLMTNKTSVSLKDVEISQGKTYRLWTNGTLGKEYFLIENRQKKGFDSYLQGKGLLVFHIDENMISNSDEDHYLVALEQADGQKRLERNLSRGDIGDPYPGSTNNSKFDANSNPSNQSYSGADTKVSITNIREQNEIVTCDISVGVGMQLPQVVKTFLDTKIQVVNKTTNDTLTQYKIINSIPDLFAEREHGITNQFITTIGYEDRFGRPESDGDYIDIILEISHTADVVNSARGVQLGGDDIEVFVNGATTGLLTKTKEIPL